MDYLIHSSNSPGYYVPAAAHLSDPGPGLTRRCRDFCRGRRPLPPPPVLPRRPSVLRPPAAPAAASPARAHLFDVVEASQHADAPVVEDGELLRQLLLTGLQHGARHGGGCGGGGGGGGAAAAGRLAPSHRPAASASTSLGPPPPAPSPRPPSQGKTSMTLAPQSRAADRASRGRRLTVPSPAAARAPAASCLPPAALPSPPPALSAPAPTEPPSPAPPLGVAAAAAAAASPAAENEAASRSPGRALGHLIGRAGAPARPDGELRLGGALARPTRLGRGRRALRTGLPPQILPCAHLCLIPAWESSAGTEWGGISMLAPLRPPPLSYKFPKVAFPHHLPKETSRSPEGGRGAFQATFA
ncbi:WAS/WASL-interacting protein family member 3-like [Zalophus californianus]|uniref:WAS/WASL-interacting protein family member 3-like n=1 Tax=Zalophus californianus TaxID=9704 RepID=A0A6J2CQ56_ZALCA|nr:WAS/WASL-interacting protein family member 3-like [Zalophus californianus]